MLQKASKAPNVDNLWEAVVIEDLPHKTSLSCTAVTETYQTFPSVVYTTEMTPPNQSTLLRILVKLAWGHVLGLHRCIYGPAESLMQESTTSSELILHK